MNDLINKSIEGNSYSEFSWNPRFDKDYNLGELINNKATFPYQGLIDFWDSPNHLHQTYLHQNQHFFIENELNEIRLKRQEDFAKRLVECIKEQHFEYGVTSMADKMVSEQMNINALATKSTINTLFVQNFKNPKILIGLLQILSRMPIQQITSEGHTMATAAIAHKNIEVKETAIRCLENWGDAEGLEILQNISVDTPWLKDYVNSVITDIQEELCPI